MPKCPYCGREIGESERHCWFCEQDMSRITPSYTGGMLKAKLATSGGS